MTDEVSFSVVIGRSHLAAAALLHASLAGGVACRLLGQAGKGGSVALVSGCGGGEAYKSIHSVGVPHKFVHEQELNGDLRSTFAAYFPGESPRWRISRPDREDSILWVIFSAGDSIDRRWGCCLGSDGLFFVSP